MIVQMYKVYAIKISCNIAVVVSPPPLFPKKNSYFIVKVYLNLTLQNKFLFMQLPISSRSFASGWSIWDLSLAHRRPPKLKSLIRTCIGQYTLYVYLGASPKLFIDHHPGKQVNVVCLCVCKYRPWSSRHELTVRDDCSSPENSTVFAWERRY